MAITSPRGGVLQIHSADGGVTRQIPQTDVCGIASGTQGALSSDGLGRISRISSTGVHRLARHDLAFDNHLVALPG